MTLRRLVVSMALLAAFGVAIAHAQQASPSAKATTPPAGPSAASEPSMPTLPSLVGSDYIIGPEDVLTISVWKNDALSRQLPVRPDGKISLPLLHDIQAAGLTAMQLQSKIATALAEFMPNPEVAVAITDVRSYRVSVLGEVQKPGMLQLKASTTILEAIALAGGFRDFASPSKIVIFRKDAQGQTKKIKFNYNRAIRNSGEQENLTLLSGDVIVVP